MYRMLKLYIKLKSFNLPHLDAVFALLEKKKTIRYIQTNDIFVDAWSYSNSIVTDRLLSQSLVVENVPFTYPDRSPLSSTLR